MAIIKTVAGGDKMKVRLRKWMKNQEASMEALKGCFISSSHGADMNEKNQVQGLKVIAQLLSPTI